jgi:hypothetical protein
VTIFVFEIFYIYLIDLVALNSPIGLFFRKKIFPELKIEKKAQNDVFSNSRALSAPAWNRASKIAHANDRSSSGCGGRSKFL